MTTPTPALASYCCPTDLHRYCPTYRQDLAPIRLRNDPDNPSCQYAYDPVACIVLLPEPTSLPPVACIVLLPEPTSLVPIRLRDDPSLASYCYPNLLTRLRADLPSDTLTCRLHRTAARTDKPRAVTPTR
ncbi:uncharacterized protein K441DRAFT_659941 [Cenococcum geophilum 1.58]|uniref:uncharacterized protein n=1 Tax=Cenococcum geophilum 1.58 TaxID=794803 RepID=UPI00358F5303|nr:hypothetical protein K441DRAFT_659941 [Cenococcum geophilum 1.58]